MKSGTFRKPPGDEGRMSSSPKSGNTIGAEKLVLFLETFLPPVTKRSRVDTFNCVDASNRDGRANTTLCSSRGWWRAEWLEELDSVEESTVP